MGYVNKVEVLREGPEYRIGDIRFSTARKHQHRMEAYGLNFKISPRTISFITDTKFFSEFPDLYRGEVLFIHAVRLKPAGEEPIERLSIDDVRSVLKKARPRLTLLAGVRQGFCICVIVPHRCNQKFRGFYRNFLEEV
jgi:hypothetical protein